jgi:hypothetical protein
MKGQILAPDGWELKFDLTVTPNYILWIKPDSVYQSTLSGQISVPLARRRIEQFINDHCTLEQLELFDNRGDER